MGREAVCVLLGNHPLLFPLPERFPYCNRCCHIFRVKIVSPGFFPISWVIVKVLGLWENLLLQLSLGIGHLNFVGGYPAGEGWVDGHLTHESAGAQHREIATQTCFWRRPQSNQLRLRPSTSADVPDKQPQFLHRTVSVVWVVPVGAPSAWPAVDGACCGGSLLLEFVIMSDLCRARLC